MQKSWRNDSDKLTFITALPPENAAEHAGLLQLEEGVYDNNNTLVGDVNLFLYEIIQDDDDEEEGDGEALKGDKHPLATSGRRFGGEVELMVASPNHRSKGLGKAVVLAFLRYVIDHADEIAQHQQADVSELKPQLSKLTAKIDKDNIPSLGLFESIGFKRKGGPGAVNYFGEVDLELPINADTRAKIEGRMGVARITDWREVRYIPN